MKTCFFKNKKQKKSKSKRNKFKQPTFSKPWETSFPFQSCRRLDAISSGIAGIFHGELKLGLICCKFGVSFGKKQPYRRWLGIDDFRSTGAPDLVSVGSAIWEKWSMNPRFGIVANFRNVQIMLGLCNRSISLIHRK